MDAEPELTRVALFETPDSPVILRHRRTAVRRFVRFLVEQAEVTEGYEGQNPLDLELTAYALLGALQELLTAHDRGEIDVSRARLTEHAAGLVEAATSVTSASVPAG